MVRHQLLFLVLAASATAAMPAYAQRTAENVVTGSEDAFGRSIGDETIGIYNAENVRGFSPLEAGNVRIEGLYFDPVGSLSLLTQGSKIRVGLTVQGYPFPAPTGIVDNELEKPGDTLASSFSVRFGPWRGISAEADVQIPIDGDRLGLVAGIGVVNEGTSFGAHEKSRSVSALLRYAPSDAFEIMPFWGHVRDIDFDANSIIYSSGAFLPKRVPRNIFKGQRWADYSGTQQTYGVIAKAKIAGFEARLGVFRSGYDTDHNRFDLLRDTDVNGRVARRVIIAEDGAKARSTSGELRVSHMFREGRREHELIVSARLRSQDRFYNDAARIDLGPSISDRPDPRPAQNYVPGAPAFDDVQQQTYGLAYRGKWLDVGEFTFAAQKAFYRKQAAQLTREEPWLFSATGAVYVTPQFALYAGHTRGLEESEIAPEDAINFNEAPPAIRTRQSEAGFRWTLSKGVNAVIGVFDITKPYFNLDAGMRFRQLGNERRRGVEVSIAGPIAKGLYLVAGSQFSDPTVSGDLVNSGQIGRRPAGAILRRTTLSLNYQLPWIDGLSVDSGLESSGDRIANQANSLVVPPRTIVSMGSRYRFNIDGKSFLLRAQMLNVFNTFGWNVNGSGGFTTNSSRRATITLSADI